MKPAFLDRILKLVLMSGMLLSLLLPGLALSQICPPPGSLLSGTASGIINNYYPGSGQASVVPGATAITLGTLDARGAATALAVGDLLMVVQMQDGSINSSNNSTYGNGSGSGNGSTSVGNAGLFEFVRITAVAGLNVTFIPALVNSYNDVNATASTTQRRYQVVRVPQYTSGTAAGVTAPAWNGATGGVVAMDVRDTLTLGSATVEGQANRAIFVAGKGFRGGLAIGSGTDKTTTTDDYATLASLGYHASKGEGFIGTPKYVAIKTNNWGFQTTNPPGLGSATLAVEGYPNGSYARGAPGNAGGGGVDSDKDGGNANNSGGGGGGNYGPGGIGGRPWNDPLKDLGGRGGAGYAGTLAFNRIFMGGGGGAGSTNNTTTDAAAYTNQGIGCALTNGQCSSGAAGGGLVVLRARAVTGSGVIDVRGAHGYNVLNDSAGGGGGGGSVILETVNGGSATIDATGGDGGNAWAGQPAWPGDRHGPGGAGGGGFIAYSPVTLGVVAAVNGGTPGETMSNAGFDEYYGGTGFNGGLTTFQTPNVPGVPQAALCDPNLTLRKSNGATSLTSPGTSTYTFTVTNSGNSATSGTMALADRLPPGLTVTPGPLTLGGASAANWSCTASSSTAIGCSSSVSIASNGTAVFSISTTVNGTSGLSVVNRAVISGGNDPIKTATATVTLADLCTANDTPAGCAVDSDTILAPNLVLTKTNGVTAIQPGTVQTYSLTVSNTGGASTAGTITVADVLPTGLTFSGTTPFTVASFTCTVVGQGITCNRTTALAASANAVITFTVAVSATAPSSVINLARVGGGGDPSPSKSTQPTTATAALCPAPIPPANTSSDPDTGCAADADAVPYVRLELSKDDGQTFVSRGGSTTYRFVVKNIGTIATAGTLNFGDVLPTATGGTLQFAIPGTFAPSGPDGTDWSCTRSAAPGTHTYCISSVSIPAGGTSAFDLTVNLSNAITTGTEVLNKARIGGGGDVTVGLFNSPTVANILACVANGNGPGCAVDLNTVQAAPEVRLTKTHPDPQVRSVGNSFAFTLRVTNTGGTNAATNSVRVIDVVPAGLTIGVVTPNSPFTCATAGQVITCNNTVSALTATAAINIVVNVTVGGTATNSLVNQAKVSATGDPQNNTVVTQALASLCAGVDVPNYGCAADPVPLNADLQVLKEQRLGSSGSFQTGLLGVSLGDTVQYRISVSNAAGSAVVSTTTFSDLIPFNLTSLTVGTVTLAGGATGCSATLSGNLVTGTVSSLPAGGSCSLIVQGSATTNTAGATNTVALTVPSGINDTNTANNTASVVTAIGSANLTVSKTNGVSTLVAGKTTSYTITIANGGPSVANGTRVYDPVAPGLSCTTNPVCLASGSASCPGGLTIGQLQNSVAPQGVAIPTLGVGGSVTLTMVCTVTATGQ
jgi:uncharacterized repeat protein (TIGR01451 family)